MSEITNYEKLSAYGLIHELRRVVGLMRKEQKMPSRDTVWAAYNTIDDDLTGLQKLIRQEGARLISEHEAKFEKIMAVEA